MANSVITPGNKNKIRRAAQSYSTSDKIPLTTQLNIYCTEVQADGFFREEPTYTEWSVPAHCSFKSKKHFLNSKQERVRQETALHTQISMAEVLQQRIRRRKERKDCPLKQLSPLWPAYLSVAFYFSMGTSSTSQSRITVWYSPSFLQFSGREQEYLQTLVI